MHDSKDFKDAESVHSGQLSHVPSESASHPFQDERGDLRGRAKIMPPNFWNTPFTSENVFTSPLAHPSSSHGRMPTPSDNPEAGRDSERTCTGQPVTKDGDGGKCAVPNQRFLKSSSTGNSFDPLQGKCLRIMWLTNKDFKSRNLILTSSLLHKLSRVGK